MTNLISAEEIAYYEIKQQILDGRLKPGARLVLRNLGKDLKVSLTPVTLALRMLERDGLVISVQGVGACVRDWDRKEIINLYEVRAFHEALAARLCAREANPLDIERISLANEAFKRAIDENDAEANIQADVEFHMAVVRSAHCVDLERMTENLSIMRCSMRIFALSLNIPESLTKSLRLSTSLRGVHQPLIDAIVSGDVDAAERLGRQHVEESLERNRVWIDEVVTVVARRQPRYTWQFAGDAVTSMR
ncbi:MAG: GntR family transcriptional regulator [Armatimonadota bacterium]